MNACHKLVFIGEPGAGKTTCIAALSDIAPVTTDVGCTDDLARRKASTTVALDYGEMDLGEQGMLRLYGLPGQERFRFMFDVVRDGAMGLVVLVDAASAQGLDGLAGTLATYADELRQRPFVLCLNKHPDPPMAFRERCMAMLRDQGLVAPLLVIDARSRSDLAQVFRMLCLLLDHGDYPVLDGERGGA
ncbi:GTP-binding protein [Pseudofulvimonas gallinarii]|jgi:signal recognition particle receptor subunit beta|uniref:G domain-containing protein n=1 Tax=Pseudofulvimonas gallinarii TaxID=634155 RepID=A0A4V2UW39_9GAMM|nr:GTPase [Pseudofulvimonas gallinarii]TCS98157.1 hypothetical protein EDC25_1099 [Pseudofulvimonas gallinarii]